MTKYPKQAGKPTRTGLYKKKSSPKNDSPASRRRAVSKALSS